MDITDAQWAVLEPLFRPKRRADGRGRPWQDMRAILNGAFWVLCTGTPWHDLPTRYPPYQICHRRQLQLGEKRGSGVGPTKRGKGSKIMAIADGHSLPLAVHVASASPHETKLVEPSLDLCFLAETPERMIGDRAYDSDPLDQRIQKCYGVPLIAPHKFVRVARATQDGRRLLRHWKVERLFA